MSNKGYQFEIQITEFFRNLFKAALKRNPENKIFRIIGSGRNKLATKTGEDTLLEGDVSVEVDSLPKNFLVECKHRKSGAEHSKSFAIKKEWVDQARTEAEKIGRWSVVAIKFKGVSPNAKELKKHTWYGKDGNSVHYIIPEKHFAEILSYIENAQNKCIIKRKVTLSEVSSVNLLREIQRRLEEVKKCSNVGKLSGGKTNLRNTGNS